MKSGPGAEELPQAKPAKPIASVANPGAFAEKLKGLAPSLDKANLSYDDFMAGLSGYTSDEEENEDGEAGKGAKRVKRRITARMREFWRGCRRVACSARVIVAS